jgi:hypothetical protein
VSPCAAGLLSAATMLSAHYVMAPSDESARGARLPEVQAVRQPGPGMDGLVPPAAVLAAILTAAKRASPSENTGAQFRLCAVPEHGLCGTVRST